MESLKTQLVLAAVMAGFLIFVSPAANARIVYHEPADGVQWNGKGTEPYTETMWLHEYILDFNMDGEVGTGLADPDHRFYSVSNYYNNGAYDYSAYYALILEGPGSTSAPVEEGDLIDGSSDWVATNNLCYHYAAYTDALYEETGGSWASGPICVGIRFNRSGKVYFGWAKLEIYRHDGLWPNGVELLSFAYEDSGAGILAGDMDSDGDGVADSEDQCPGSDDSIDIDGDGTPDGCDALIDSDDDGVADSEDICPDHDDTIDADADGIPDGCDDLIDTDSDGIEDEEEAGSNGDDFTYDGNSDGTPDYDQSNVASFYDVNGHYVTLAVNTPGVLSNVFPVNEENTPENAEFPCGLFYFVVEGLSSPTVTITLPQEVAVDSYYKYGGTADNTDPHWYEFMYDEESETGAVINGQEITLYFVDGERGDNDLDGSNLTVIDPGGPMVVSETVSDDTSADTMEDASSDDSTDDTADTYGTGTASGGGGGCFISSLFE